MSETFDIAGKDLREWSFIILMLATDYGWDECMLFASVADVFGCMVLGGFLMALGMVIELIWGRDENITWLIGLGLALVTFAFLAIAMRGLFHRR